MINSDKTRTVLRFRNRETIHFSEPIEIDVDGQVVRLPGEGSDQVTFDELKAVFFLGPPSSLPTTGSHLSIEFDDGEVIRGVAPEYNPTRAGFYLYPEGEDHVRKAFIVAAAIVSIDIDRL